MKVSRIYSFGDSLVAGIYDTQGGWCDRLKKDMHRITSESTDGTKRQVYNLGIEGETSRGLAARIKQELGARHSPAWPAIILIGTGKNDSRQNNGIPEVSLEEYEENLRTIIRHAREITNMIVLVGLGPCAEDEITFKQFTYSRQQLSKYNDVLTKVAQEMGVKKVEIYDSLVQSAEAVFYRDKLHPSDEGYRLIYEAIKPAVMEFLEASD